MSGFWVQPVWTPGMLVCCTVILSKLGQVRLRLQRLMPKAVALHSVLVAMNFLAFLRLGEGLEDIQSES